MSAQRLVLAPRRALALLFIAEHPGASNREIAAGVGVSDEAQMSRLLRRMADLGLAVNTNDGGNPGGPHAWCVTAEGRVLAREAQSAAGSDRTAGW
jgi:predicted transcriptional regulator